MCCGIFLRGSIHVSRPTSGHVSDLSSAISQELLAAHAKVDK